MCSVLITMPCNSQQARRIALKPRLHEWLLSETVALTVWASPQIRQSCHGLLWVPCTSLSQELMSQILRLSSNFTIKKGLSLNSEDGARLTCGARDSSLRNRRHVAQKTGAEVSFGSCMMLPQCVHDCTKIGGAHFLCTGARRCSCAEGFSVVLREPHLPNVTQVGASFSSDECWPNMGVAGHPNRADSCSKATRFLRFSQSGQSNGVQQETGPELNAMLSRACRQPTVQQHYTGSTSIKCAHAPATRTAPVVPSLFRLSPATVSQTSHAPQQRGTLQL